MLVRSFWAGLPAVLVLTTAAQAQAPRHTSTAKYDNITITIEHGQPPWTEDRLQQIAQMPPGQPWRMGAEGLTTIDIKGGPVLFGDKIVKPARYGVNLARVTGTDWAFVLFEPLHEADANGFQMRGDEPSQNVATKFIGDAATSTAALSLDLTSDEHCGKCELSWGPMRVSATIAPVTVTSSSVTINSLEAEAQWFKRPIAADADLSQPMLAGRIKLEIDDEDCSMNVYVMAQGDQIVALLRNVEREQWENESARIADQKKLLDAALQQFGAQAEAQIKPVLDDLKRKEARNEVYLDGSTGRPDNLKYSEKAYEAKGNTLHCELVKTRSGLRLEVFIGAKTSVLALDESKFVMKTTE